jgi:DNA-binding LytR/AlgR family response regulator
LAASQKKYDYDIVNEFCTFRDGLTGLRNVDKPMNTLNMWLAGHAISIPECVNDSLDDRAAQHSSTLVIPHPAKQKSRSTKVSPGRHSLVESRSLRVAIKVPGKILFIRLCDVISVRAKGKCVWLQLNATSYLLRESISEIAQRLETHGFIRIHRSVIVNSSFVEEIRPLSTGEYCLRVEGGKEYTVTRTYKNNLKLLAELWIGTSPFLSG